MSHFTKVLRRCFAVFLFGVLLLSLSSCAGGNTFDAPRIVLNGKKLHGVYTSHYSVKEDCVVIPLSAFLLSIGAEYADSPLNAYHVTCYSFMGKRYVLDDDARLFMLEDDYVTLSNELDAEGKELTRKNAAGRDLFSENDDAISIPTNEATWSTVYVDHVSLMNALRKSGIDITIQFDYSKRKIIVDCPEQSD